MQQLIKRTEPARESLPATEPVDDIDEFMDFASLGGGTLGPPAPPPFRRHHGESPGIEEREAFLDETVLTAAVAGSLSP